MPSLSARPAGPFRMLVIAADTAIVGDAAALQTTLGVVPAVLHAPNGRAAAQALREQSADVLLADLGCLGDLDPNMESALARLARLAQDALLLTLSQDRSVSTAMGAMRAGAHDHAVLPIAATALAARIAALAIRHGRIDLVPLTIPAPLEPCLTIRPPAPANTQRPGRDILPMWRQEQRIIEDAIERSGGNIALAAAALEISPSTIYRKKQAWADMGGEARGAA